MTASVTTGVREIARNAGVDMIAGIARRFSLGDISLEDGLDELWVILEMMPRIASAEDRAEAYQRICAALDEEPAVPQMRAAEPEGAPGAMPTNVSAKPWPDGTVCFTVQEPGDDNAMFFDGFALDAWISPAGARAIAVRLLAAADQADRCA